MQIIYSRTVDTCLEFESNFLLILMISKFDQSNFSILYSNTESFNTGSKNNDNNNSSSNFNNVSKERVYEGFFKEFSLEGQRILFVRYEGIIKLVTIFNKRPPYIMSRFLIFIINKKSNKKLTFLQRKLFLCLI
jgi:hypothetical protein